MGSAWAGHADFYHECEPAGQVLVVYRWRSVEEHRQLAAHEEPELEESYRTHCSAPRAIPDYIPLPADADHGDGWPTSVMESDSFDIVSRAVA
jgi:hypothetical protein